MKWSENSFRLSRKFALNCGLRKELIKKCVFFFRSSLRMLVIFSWFLPLGCASDCMSKLHRNNPGSDAVNKGWKGAIGKKWEELVEMKGNTLNVVDIGKKTTTDTTPAKLSENKCLKRTVDTPNQSCETNKRVREWKRNEHRKKICVMNFEWVTVRKEWERNAHIVFVPCADGWHRREKGTRRRGHEKKYHEFSQWKRRRGNGCTITSDKIEEWVAQQLES